MTEELYGPGSPATEGIANNYAVFLERGGEVDRSGGLYRRSVAA